MTPVALKMVHLACTLNFVIMQLIIHILTALYMASSCNRNVCAIADENLCIYVVE